MPEIEIPWLIWSNEHGRWWKPGRRGYTPIIGEAGRYTRSAADMICRDANYRPDVVNEVAVLAPEAFDLIRAAMPADSATVWDDRLTPCVPAGDRRVMLSGSPSRVPVRVLSEENFQASLLAHALIAEGATKK